MVVHFLGPAILEIRPADEPPLLTMAGFLLGRQMPLIYDLFIVSVVLFRSPFCPVALEPYVCPEFLRLSVTSIGVLAFLPPRRLCRQIGRHDQARRAPLRRAQIRQDRTVRWFDLESNRLPVY